MQNFCHMNFIQYITQIHYKHHFLLMYEFLFNFGLNSTKKSMQIRFNTPNDVYYNFILLNHP
jgi:hypothetical protein